MLRCSSVLCLGGLLTVVTGCFESFNPEREVPYSCQSGQDCLDDYKCVIALESYPKPLGYGVCLRSCEGAPENCECVTLPSFLHSEGDPIDSESVEPGGNFVEPANGGLNLDFGFIPSTPDGVEDLGIDEGVVDELISVCLPPSLKTPILTDYSLLDAGQNFDAFDAAQPTVETSDMSELDSQLTSLLDAQVIDAQAVDAAVSPPEAQCLSVDTPADSISWVAAAGDSSKSVASGDRFCVEGHGDSCRKMTKNGNENNDISITLNYGSFDSQNVRGRLVIEHGLQNSSSTSARPYFKLVVSRQFGELPPFEEHDLGELAGNASLTKTFALPDTGSALLTIRTTGDDGGAFGTNQLIFVLRQLAVLESGDSNPHCQRDCFSATPSGQCEQLCTCP